MMSQKAVLPLVLAAIVTSLGAWSLTRTAQAESISPPPRAHWSYLCLDGGSSTEVMKKANQAGSQGWEMVAGSDGVWCFKQPSHARPAAPR